MDTGGHIQLKWNHAVSRYTGNSGADWLDFGDPLVSLAHELKHVYDVLFLESGPHPVATSDTPSREVRAMIAENAARLEFMMKVPSCAHLVPRPGYDRNRYHAPIDWGGTPVYP